MACCIPDAPELTHPSRTQHTPSTACMRPSEIVVPFTFPCVARWRTQAPTMGREPNCPVPIPTHCETGLICESRLSRERRKSLKGVPAFRHVSQWYGVRNRASWLVIIWALTRLRRSASWYRLHIDPRVPVHLQDSVLGQGRRCRHWGGRSWNLQFVRPEICRGGDSRSRRGCPCCGVRQRTFCSELRSGIFNTL
jgi:hypothetical protein